MRHQQLAIAALAEIVDDFYLTQDDEASRGPVLEMHKGNRQSIIAQRGVGSGCTQPYKE